MSDVPFEVGARVLIRRRGWPLVPDHDLRPGTVVWDDGGDVIDIRLDSVPENTEVVPFRFGEDGGVRTAVQRWCVTPLDVVTDLGLLVDKRELEG